MELEEAPISPRPLCDAHGLVAGPDGRCVVCRRPPGQSALLPEPEPEALGPQVLFTWALGGMAVAALVALIFTVFGGGSTPDRSPRPASAASPMRAKTPPAQTETSDPQAVLAQQRAQAAAAKAELARQQAKAEQQRATEEQDRRRKEMIETDRAKRALAHARRNITVVMYATSWCPSCKAAREYMRAQNISYVEHDIDQSESAKQIMHRLNPKQSVPTIDVEGEILVGFGQSQLEATLDSAARKRAGI